jgi:hypothetical protein
MEELEDRIFCHFTNIFEFFVVPGAELTMDFWARMGTIWKRT